MIIVTIDCLVDDVLKDIGYVEDCRHQLSDCEPYN